MIILLDRRTRMKKILVYGDSNVWGDNFSTGVRIDDGKQWPVILQKKLGNDYKILQEGLPGRIAGNQEDIKKYKNGKDTFISTFRTNAPVDTLIISLGTNDLQIKYNKSFREIVDDLLWYRKVVYDSYLDVDDRKKFFKDGKMPNIIYILPVNFDYEVNAKDIFNIDSERKRQDIISLFNKSDQKFLVVNDISLLDDGIHLSDEGHKRMVDLVMEVLGDE